MATIVNEQVVSGRKFRKLIDEASRLWLRISFWTKACDVEFDDGENAETKFADMSSRITDLATSFRDGVNKIFNYLKGLGFTPATNSPDGICQAVQNMYNKRYSDGRLQGQNDVKENPSDYGISTGVPFSNIKATNWRTDFGGSEVSCYASTTGFVRMWFYISAAYANPHNSNSFKLILKINGVTKQIFNAIDIGIDPTVLDQNSDVHIESDNFNFDGTNCNAGDLVTFVAETYNASGQLVIAVS